MTKENKKFDDGLRAIMGDADFDKAVNPELKKLFREHRAPNGQYEEVVKSMDRVLAKMDAMDKKLEFLLRYLEL
tara:strand:- start:23 stop:244 length:222 start_codon:yes stop_codon:yes gene_type:complete